MKKPAETNNGLAEQQPPIAQFDLAAACNSPLSLADWFRQEIDDVNHGLREGRYFDPAAVMGITSQYVADVQSRRCLLSSDVETFNKITGAYKEDLRRYDLRFSVKPPVTPRERYAAVVAAAWPEGPEGEALIRSLQPDVDIEIYGWGVTITPPNGTPRTISRKQYRLNARPGVGPLALVPDARWLVSWAPIPEPPSDHVESIEPLKSNYMRYF
jgi:hypothetical protein